MKRTLAVRVYNESGVLTRVASVFSSRGYNIDSIAVGSTETYGVSRIIIILPANAQKIEQVTKQLNKLIQVIEVNDITERACVERELMLIKVKIIKENRSEILELAKIFRAKVVDISLNSVTFEIAGDAGKIITFQQLLENFEVLEIVRSGKIALERDLGLNTEILKKI
jgi:acetolactate synthase-1/3 small subunit